MNKDVSMNILLIFIGIVLFVYNLSVLNFYFNVKDTCSNKCHDDVKRIIILLFIFTSILLPAINAVKPFNSLNYVMILFANSMVLHLTQFIYLRQLKNECSCGKSLIMDIMRILNYFALYIVIPINIVFVSYLKYHGML